MQRGFAPSCLWRAGRPGKSSWYKGLMKYTYIPYLVQHPRECSGCVCTTREPWQRGEPFSMGATMWTGRTEQANFVANIVVLHEELVTIDYMLIEVPSNSLIQKRRKPLKKRLNDARRKVCSYSCLRTHRQSALETVKWGTHLVVAQLVLDFIFPQK